MTLGGRELAPGCELVRAVVGLAVQVAMRWSVVCSDGAISGRFVVAEGARSLLALSIAHQEPLVLPARDQVERRLERTARVWERWSDDRRYDGPWRESVLRSVLALKLLVSAPTGAVAAAATTSLPEEIGGVRNWDYRYAWVRDSAFAVDALLELGCVDDAHASFWWLMHASQLTHPRLNVLYDLDGGNRVPERELPLQATAGHARCASGSTSKAATGSTATSRGGSRRRRISSASSGACPTPGSGRCARSLRTTPHHSGRAARGHGRRQVVPLSPIRRRRHRRALPAHRSTTERPTARSADDGLVGAGGRVRRHARPHHGVARGQRAGADPDGHSVSYSGRRSPATGRGRRRSATRRTSSRGSPSRRSTVSPSRRSGRAAGGWARSSGSSTRSSPGR